MKYYHKSGRKILAWKHAQNTSKLTSSIWITILLYASNML